ncbi:hypothetical protein H4219_002740 [Mycoemilia scoparia]|uniref:Uncharacterized protein n=1 Tax=Mycoemilia scoparia TaxID=417184 RepID=A0A9W7ZXG3_9FUNG|nr:hypothetical protein H4219_002740 [Mycoemilia scoparia]
MGKGNKSKKKSSNKKSKSTSSSSNTPKASEPSPAVLAPPSQEQQQQQQQQQQKQPPVVPEKANPTADKEQAPGVENGPGEAPKDEKPLQDDGAVAEKVIVESNAGVPESLENKPPAELNGTTDSAPAPHDEKPEVPNTSAISDSQKYELSKIMDGQNLAVASAEGEQINVDVELQQSAETDDAQHTGIINKENGTAPMSQTLDESIVYDDKHKTGQSQEQAEDAGNGVIDPNTEESKDADDVCIIENDSTDTKAVKDVADGVQESPAESQDPKSNKAEQSSHVELEAPGQNTNGATEEPELVVGEQSNRPGSVEEDEGAKGQSVNLESASTLALEGGVSDQLTDSPLATADDDEVVLIAEKEESNATSDGHSEKYQIDDLNETDNLPTKEESEADAAVLLSEETEGAADHEVGQKSEPTNEEMSTQTWAEVASNPPADKSDVIPNEELASSLDRRYPKVIPEDTSSVVHNDPNSKVTLVKLEDGNREYDHEKEKEEEEEEEEERGQIQEEKKVTADKATRKETKDRKKGKSVSVPSSSLVSLRSIALVTSIISGSLSAYLFRLPGSNRGYALYSGVASGVLGIGL